MNSLLSGIVILYTMMSIPSFSNEFIGIIKPIHDVKVSVSLDGVVEQVFVKEGSLVKKGDKLLKLEDSLQSLELNRRKIVWKDKAQLSASIKNRKIQKELLDSTRKLYDETRSVSKDELKLLESKYHVLNGDIKMRQENEKKEKVEYLIANKLLSKHTITSPITGYVTELNLQKGEWAKSGKPFIRLVNTEVCFVDINIDEEYSSNMKVGSHVDFTVKTKSVTANKTGKIAFISPVADMASGLVRIKIEFPNVENRVTPGLSATINIDNLSTTQKEEQE
jgi:RND family efflux transporter MFP subunit